MTPTESLIHLAISHSNRTVELALIKRVTTDLMEGRKPNDSDMKDLAICYQRDPIMCTLDYQELQDFVDDIEQQPTIADYLNANEEMLTKTKSTVVTIGSLRKFAGLE